MQIHNDKLMTQYKATVQQAKAKNTDAQTNGTSSFKTVFDEAIFTTVKEPFKEEPIITSDPKEARAWWERNVKYADRKIFVSQRVLDAGVNLNSTGGAKLTAEQRQDLHERYDVNNMTEDEQFRFFVELTNLGVLSGKEFIMRTSVELDFSHLGVHSLSDDYPEWCSNTNDLLGVVKWGLAEADYWGKRQYNPHLIKLEAILEEIKNADQMES